MKRIIILLKNWYESIVAPFELIKDNFGSLVAYEVFCRVMSFLVLFPILAWAEKLWLLGNKTNVIAWYNVGSFIKNPISWIVLLFMMAVLAWGTMIEQFSLFDALHASKSGLKKTAGQIISAGIGRMFERSKAVNLLFIPYVFLVLRFGTLTGDISSVISVVEVPGFILEDFSKRPWEGALFACFQVIAIYLYLRWIYIVPVMIEEDEVSILAACRKSAAMTRGKHLIKLVLLLAEWSLLILFFYYAGTAVIIVEWYLLSLWLMRGAVEPFNAFFTARFVPVSLIFYLFILWIATPIILAVYQCTYYRRKEQLGEELNGYREPPQFFRKYPVLKWWLIALCAVSIFVSGPQRFEQIKWMLNTDYGTAMIMAHRGYSAQAPENTIPAFQMCIDNRFTAAELDVQMLADGTVVVLHDDNLKRTTGVNKNVWEVTYDEIKDLDNGSFFKDSFAGTTIPTFDEVMRLAGHGNDKLYLNIEIKRNGHDDGIVEEVVEIIRKNNYMDHCDVTSQDYETLEEVRKVDPEILTAYTSAIGIGDIDTLDAADIISIQETFATYENIDRIHRAGKRVFVWTVNEEDTMKRLVSLNVDAILTNDPALCRSVIDQYDSNIMNIVQRIHSAFSFL
ncbi:MAG: glycerophosphoryl diester phosphodiesterase membrane domain-containing protein [Mogibacterium sp.]|nr:glycerophosphoryl diester phosphodiesterase membrane domain-containing protein [Mogibacterium sp.]